MRISGRPHSESCRCGYFASVIHDLHTQPAAPDHRRDRYAAVIVLVQNTGHLTCGKTAVTMKAMKYHAAGEPTLNIELTINERHALETAAQRLHSEFSGAFDAETVERLVESSY